MENVHRLKCEVSTVIVTTAVGDQTVGRCAGKRAKPAIVVVGRRLLDKIDPIALGIVLAQLLAALPVRRCRFHRAERSLLGS